MSREHYYDLAVTWTGNTGKGTATYRSYERDHVVSAPGKPDILSSADPTFLGNESRWNPELQLIAALSQCHLLWYLHLAAGAGIQVMSYRDQPSGVMVEENTGAGQFESVTLHPHVTVADPADLNRADQLHHRVDEYCFISRSVNFAVKFRPTTRVYSG